jgi:hypothetical protein
MANLQGRWSSEGHETMTKAEALALADRVDAVSGLRALYVANAVGEALDRQSPHADLYLTIRARQEWWLVHGVRTRCGHRFAIAYADVDARYDLKGSYADHCAGCSKQ